MLLLELIAKDVLVKHGATGVLYEYQQGTGRIEALRFRLKVGEQDVNFSLPVNWRKFQRVLQLQEVKRCDDEDYVHCVAWCNLRDWVLASLLSVRPRSRRCPRCSCRSPRLHGERRSMRRW